MTDPVAASTALITLPRGRRSELRATVGGILRRLGVYVITLWVAVTINFLLPRLAPGDPTQRVVAALAQRTGQDVPPATVDAIRAIMGDTDQNLFVQYVGYLGSILRLDFGVSVSQYPIQVVDVISAAVPWTLYLVVTGTVVSWIIGTGLGLYAGWRRGSVADRVISLGSVVTISLPSFWIALVVLWVFGYTLAWFPNSGAYDQSLDPGFNSDFIFSVMYYGFLPILTVVLVSFAGWSMSMRNMAAITTLEDYVLLAKAKGLSPFRVAMAYTGRNAVLPNATGLAQAIGHSIGGVVLIEIVYGYPGLGTELRNAVDTQDLPVMQGIFLLITIVVLISNFASDVINGFIDPRTRQGGKN